MTKFLKKSKNHDLGLCYVFFVQISAKINFSGKKMLCQFLNIPIIYHQLSNGSFLRKTTNKKFDSSNSLSLALIAGIELIAESLSIFNPGFS